MKEKWIYGNGGWVVQTYDHLSASRSQPTLRPEYGSGRQYELSQWEGRTMTLHCPLTVR